MLENEWPATSLIICSRSRQAILAETVTSILTGTRVPTELVIIDQSDAPSVPLEALTTDRAGVLRYLWSQTIGLSRANNLGVAAARYDLVAFTHDDVLAAPDWFETLVCAAVTTGKRIRSEHRLTYGDVALIGGILTGAAWWFLTQGWMTHSKLDRFMGAKR